MNSPDVLMCSCMRSRNPSGSVLRVKHRCRARTTPTGTNGRSEEQPECRDDAEVHTCTAESWCAPVHRTAAVMPAEHTAQTPASAVLTTRRLTALPRAKIHGPKFSISTNLPRPSSFIHYLLTHSRKQQYLRFQQSLLHSLHSTFFNTNHHHHHLHHAAHRLHHPPRRPR